MSSHRVRPLAPADPSRRTFVKGLAAGGAVAGLGLWRQPSLWAQAQGLKPTIELSGTDFDLTIGETPVNFTGRPRIAYTINGSIPAPILRWREGDTVTLRVRNTLRREDASIHWHGILLPANMDGVPGLSFHGIHPGESYTYQFTVKQNGTYWYHSHSGFDEQKGLYGALVIDAAEPSPVQYDREHVVLLSDWTDEDPRRIFAKLKKQSDYYNFNKRTVGDFFRDVRQHGLSATLADRRMWGQMRMNPTDLSDVTGYTYTYLMNGATPHGNWTGLFTPGERVRLRFINGSAQSYFDVRIPGLKLTVIAADGQYVKPVEVDEFRIATAETYDVIVEPSGAEAFTIFAQSIDRTGYAAGTLAVRHGLRAPVPEPDPPQLLTMADMGHDMAGHDHGAMTAGAAAAADPHAGHHMPAAKPADPHAGHAMPAQPPKPPDPHAGHDMPKQPPAAQDPHAGHDMAAMTAGVQTHPASEQGNPLVDMQAMNPMPRLDDPGVGLRGNGRRVLTYADLRSVFDDSDGREPGRTIELHLTGHMEKFAWSFDGIKFSDAPPIRLQYGERLRVVLVNDTMMSHPIHLHGMWSDLENEQGAFMVRKHTIDMPPGTKRSFRVRADALGRWAFHCHLLYHMESGMFREVRVEE
ncbi:MAG TPA: copper resistance system multicopper oxidase [Vicinamibacterales bacterium]|nr:copper resistance system multicopper oxidase [Vicinamibacterales bacterium]